MTTRSPSEPIPLAGKLVLLGAGKMGGAMMAGWLASGIDPAQIVVLDPSPPDEIRQLIDDNNITLNPPQPCELDNVEVILAAVKPQIMDEAIKSVVCLGIQSPLILSIAAGRTIASFEAHFGANAAVVRTIPNTPAAIGRGITAMAANPHVSDAQRELAASLLAALGEVVEVDSEDLIDAVTGLSGSGPAYVFFLAECLARAGEKVGLPPHLSAQLARATLAGAGELLHQSDLAPGVLRDNVTSPNGTTYAGLQVLMDEEHGIGPVVEKTVAAATARSKELSKP